MVGAIRRLSFEELVARYKKDIRTRPVEESLGLLHASLQAKHASPEKASEEIVEFLLWVADVMRDDRDWELREEAQKLLARKIGEKHFSAGVDNELVRKLHEFYHRSPKHTPSSPRDRALVHAFLRATVKDFERGFLTMLLVNVGDYTWLREENFYDAIPLLYSRLFEMLREQGGENFERLAKVHDVGELVMHPFPDELQMVDAQPKGVPQQQTEYFMELVRLHTLCGIAFTHYRDQQIRECAETLLHLVSCSATVNGNHYDQDH